MNASIETRMFTWIDENINIAIKAEKRKGPRKPKSWPLRAAQNVYTVRLTITTAARIDASKMIFPVCRHQESQFNSPIILSMNFRRRETFSERRNLSQ